MSFVSTEEVFIKVNRDLVPKVVSDGEDPLVVSDNETTVDDDSDEVINAAEVTATLYLDSELLDQKDDSQGDTTVAIPVHYKENI